MGKGPCFLEIWHPVPAPAKEGPGLEVRHCGGGWGDLMKAERGSGPMVKS